MMQPLVRQESLKERDKIVTMVQLSNQNSRMYRTIEKQQNANQANVENNDQAQLLQKSKHRESLPIHQVDVEPVEKQSSGCDREEEIHQLKKEISSAHPNPEQQKENTPITTFYTLLTNKTDDTIQLKIIYNYDRVSPKYYVVNKLFDADFTFSEAMITVKNNTIFDMVLIKLSITDIGQFPYLLIQDQTHQFIIPLTYQPVEPCFKHKTTFDSIKKNLYNQSVNIIDLDSGSVTYGSFNTVQNVFQLLNDKGKNYANYDQIEMDCTLPCVLHLTPGEHPCTFQSQKWFDECIIYQNRLTFAADVFFVESFSDIINKNDTLKKICNDSSHYIIFKLRSHLFALNFETRVQCNFCYIALKHYQNKLFTDFQYINQTMEKFIKTSRSLQEQKYVFEKTKPQLFQIMNQKQFCVGDILELKFKNKNVNVSALISTADCIIGNIQFQDQKPFELQQNLAFKIIELFGFTNYEIQAAQLTQKLLPPNNENIVDRMDQLNERGIIVRVTIIDLLKEKHPVKLILISDKIMFECEDLKIRFETIKYNIAVNFSYKNHMLLTMAHCSYDLEYIEKDFYFLNLFFG